MQANEKQMPAEEGRANVQRSTAASGEVAAEIRGQMTDPGKIRLLTSAATSPPAPSSASLDLAAIRAKLDSVHGQKYWRSLDELADTPAFQQMLHCEFPVGASEWEDGVSRRSFLKLAAA